MYGLRNEFLWVDPMSPCQRYLHNRFHVVSYGIPLILALISSLVPGQPCRGQQLPDSPTWCGTDEADQRLLNTLIRPHSGIILEPVYHGEVFTNARGGVTTKNATRYQGLLDLLLTA